MPVEDMGRGRIQAPKSKSLLLTGLKNQFTNQTTLQSFRANMDNQYGPGAGKKILRALTSLARGGRLKEATFGYFKTKVSGRYLLGMSVKATGIRRMRKRDTRSVRQLLKGKSVTGDMAGELISALIREQGKIQREKPVVTATLYKNPWYWFKTDHLTQSDKKIVPLKWK
jgi:hypothetical protein